MSPPQTTELDGIGVVTKTLNKSVLTTPNPFEKRFGYYRAVRRGPFIFVSGTTAVEFTTDAIDAGQGAGGPTIRYPGDAFKQAEFAMQRCQEAVEALGGCKEDIVRVKMYVAKYEDCGAVGDAYKAILSKSSVSDLSAVENDMIGAAATMLVVPGGFVDKQMLVEIEVDAYCV